MKNHYFIALGLILCGMMAIAIAMIASSPPAQAMGRLHGTPDHNATPIVDEDDHHHDTPTYYADVEPILQANCAGCHLEGGIGHSSFSMENVNDIVEPKSADYIAFVTGIRYMPPWPPSEESLPFLHERTLTDEEIATIAAWAEAGAPLGDEADRQPPPTSTDIPTIRADVVLTMPEPYTPNAALTDDYRCFLLDTHFDGDQYMTGYTIDPDADAIVHHVIVFQLDASVREVAEAKDAAEEGAGWQCFGGPNLPMSGSRQGTSINVDTTALNAALGKQGFQISDILSALQAKEIPIEAANMTIIIQTLDEMGVDLNQLFADMGIDFTRLQAESIGTRGILAAWVPGAVPTVMLPNTGRYIPQDTVLVMQVHYNLTAGVQPDQTSFVMQLEPYSPNIIPQSSAVFVAPVEIPCPEGVENPACDRDVAMQEVQSRQSDAILAMCGQDLSTYADNTAENAYGYCDYTIPYDGWMVEVSGHMHELGEQTRVTINPDTPNEVLVIDIPDWDFHWQGSYQLAEPLPVKAGDVLRLECWWDNSDGERYIVWGEGTSDEMCFNPISFIWNPLGTLSIEDIMGTTG